MFRHGRDDRPVPISQNVRKWLVGPAILTQPLPSRFGLHLELTPPDTRFTTVALTTGSEPGLCLALIGVLQRVDPGNYSFNQSLM
jgi:hypothetical protein